MQVSIVTFPETKAARYLFDDWLPRSGKEMAKRPIVFHYVNVGPDVREQEAITDVYLPLVWRGAGSATAARAAAPA